MKKLEKMVFIDEHIELIRRKIIEKVDEIPDRWEGLELKQYIADSFSIPKHWFSSSKRRYYNNDIIVKNL